jgi:putative ABC transport system permease protein
LLIPDTTEKLLPSSVQNILQDRRLSEIVTASSPEVFVAAELNGTPIMLIGADLKSLKKLYPGWVWEPATVQDNDVYIGKRLANRLRVKKGSTVLIASSEKNISIKISGTLESGESEDDQLFIPIASARELISNHDATQLIAISALGEATDVEKRFKSALTGWPGVQFQVIRKIASAEETILNRISNLMSLVIGIIFVILFFCINTTVSALLLGRQSEIALLRILGARRKQIMVGLTLELLVLAIMGGLLGFVGGIFVAQVLGKILFQTYIEPHPIIFWITIASSMAMMVLCSFLPIRRAINRQAATVLKEA